jgi:hypothetical protein
MMQAKKAPSLFRFDFVTVLIVLFFLALTFAVYLYYKHRIKEIQTQLKQSRALLVRNDSKSVSEIGYLVTLVQ